MEVLQAAGMPSFPRAVFFERKVLGFIYRRKIQNSLENFEGLEFSKNRLTFLLKNNSLKKDIGNKINILFTCHQQKREFMHCSLIMAVLSGYLINPLFDLRCAFLRL